MNETKNTDLQSRVTLLERASEAQGGTDMSPDDPVNGDESDIRTLFEPHIVQIVSVLSRAAASERQLTRDHCLRIAKAEWGKLPPHTAHLVFEEFRAFKDALESGAVGSGFPDDLTLTDIERAEQVFRDHVMAPEPRQGFVKAIVSKIRR